ncbi:MAG: hypothetical protein JSY10_10305 [Paenibacillus sp.]|uniref:hypothetical protein n=1 Tax=Paenibacillus illinoisensis TaxID=59845 RepID=UPI000FD8C402|nr:hypothetical protein [Paenibacillus illinoisensis]MBM6384365.1 hypothetical protein [Paenibacillus sp.]
MNFQEVLIKLALLTVQMVDRLSEVTYEELESFTGERELLVQQLLFLQEKPTEEEKEQIVSILSYDSLIKSRMEFFKNEASDFLEKQGAIKAQQVAYQTTYIPDSLFIDDRK